MTNGDKWRAMSDEQLVDIIETNCMSCPCKDECNVVYYSEHDEEADNKCHTNILNWLRKEIDE